MFKKRHRLTKAMFDQSFRQGKRFHSPELQLIHDKTTPDFHGAVVVGKKVYKKAVLRNKLRRRIYGVLYRWQKTHQATGTYILVAKPSITSVDRKNLTTLVEKILPEV